MADPRRLRWLGLLLFCVLVAGCANLSYYWQAAAGQAEIWRKVRPVDDWLHDPSLPAATRQALQRAQVLRQFAIAELGLPDNASYRQYADVGRDYVVWNVFAAPELSLQLHTWCFPVAGCVGYRGYFSEAAARELADELRSAGWDVQVAGIPAYSTLGWFDDPILNTWLRLGDLEIARLMFHELAHQVAYAADDPNFNEAYATLVEQAGIERWLQHQGSPAEQQAWQTRQARQQQFLALLQHTRAQLAAAYRDQPTPAAQRAAKQRILAQLQTNYQTLRDGPWQGYRGYDAWFRRDINNAVLGAVATYHQQVPFFRCWFERNQGDFRRFHQQVITLAALPKTERSQRLEQCRPQDAPPRS